MNCFRSLSPWGLLLCSNTEYKEEINMLVLYRHVRHCWLCVSLFLCSVARKFLFLDCWFVISIRCCGTCHEPFSLFVFYQVFVTAIYCATTLFIFTSGVVSRRITNLFALYFLSGVVIASSITVFTTLFLCGDQHAWDPNPHIRKHFELLSTDELFPLTLPLGFVVV